MRSLETGIIYENPLPQLRSRQCFFPSLCLRADGTLAAVFAIGEAFESVDSTSFICFSKDDGKTWTQPKRMFPSAAAGEVPITDYCKITALPDGRLAALGYAYRRDDPEKPIGNPENGGLLDDFVFWSVRRTAGRPGARCGISSAPGDRMWRPRRP